MQHKIEQNACVPDFQCEIRNSHLEYTPKLSAYEIKVRVTPEKRSIIKDHADAMGESATAFINRAIDEAMERDKKSNPET